MLSSSAQHHDDKYNHMYPGGNLLTPTLATVQDEKPGHERKLSDLGSAIRFSRKFVPTYNLVLLVLLVLLAVQYWVRRWTYAQRRRAIAVAAHSSDGGNGGGRTMGTKGSSPALCAVDAVDEGGYAGSSSSSSSTVAGNSTPPDVKNAEGRLDGERTPLLDHSGRHRSARSDWSIGKIVKGWLMYQPRRIPIVDRALPSNGVSVVVVLYYVLNLVYLFYGLPPGIVSMVLVTERAGLLIVVNLPLLYLLGAKNQPITWLTGRSYEAINIFHRRVGEWLCFLALIHAAGMFMAWALFLRQRGFTLVQFISNRIIIFGLLSFFCYETIYFTSLSSFRRRWYELFLAVHVFLQAGALVFVFLHHSNARPYALSALLIFVVDRLLFRLWLKTTSETATLTILPDNSTVLLSSNWNVPQTRSSLLQHLFQHSTKHGWVPTDHVFLTVSSLPGAVGLQGHPFTIFSGAPVHNREDGSSHAWFSLLIRAHDGFSRSLLDYAQTHKHANIRLDGPYGGSSHTLDMLKSSPNRLIIAGGSGIAVAYPLLWALSQEPQNEGHLAGERSQLRGTTCLVWVTRSGSHKSWLSESQLEELRVKGIDIIMPAPTESDGRLDTHSFVTQWIQDCGPRGNVTAIASGPDSLNRDVTNACAEMVIKGWDVDVVVEKFGW